MRIAISGTHCSGKSTLVEEFLLMHRSFEHEPEAYEAMHELNDETYPEPTAESFFAQLEYHVHRLQQHKPGDRVIFERCPIDYVVYLDALLTLKRSSADSHLAKQSISIARDAVRLLDLIAFLPGTEIQLVSEDEDPKLRDEVDAGLEDILMNDSLDMFGDASPRVIQLTGSTAQRLAVLSSKMTL
jgi:deoxyadenosine/deoxycytidine kinase